MLEARQVALRPGIGTLGQKVQLRTNYLRISKVLLIIIITNSCQLIYVYCILIYFFFYILKKKVTKFKTILVQLYCHFNSGRKPGKKLRWKIFEELKKQKIFNNLLPVFNGND